MIDICYLENTPDGNLIIRLPESIYKLCKETSGSYNVFLARLYDLKYGDFLRMCRDKYKAILKGKQGYSIAIWKPENKKEASKLINDLNNRWGTWLVKAKADGLLN